MSLSHPLPPEIQFIERGWFNSNHILVAGSGKPTVIDTGHLASAQETVQVLRDAGVSPESLGLIVSTHGHSDHHGGNSCLRELSKAPVALGSITAEWFRRGQLQLAWLDHFSQEYDLVQADQILTAGEITTFSGVDFEIVSLPGHAPDTIGFFQPDSRVMLSADAMWLGDLGVLHPAVHGWEILEQAERAIQSIVDRRPRIVLPGHGPPIVDVEENAEVLLRRLQLFAKEPARLAWHLVRRFLVYGILRYQPISRESLLSDEALAGDHTLSQTMHYYFDLIIETEGPNANSPAQILSRTLDEFLDRGVLCEEEGWLTSSLPR